MKRNKTAIVLMFAMALALVMGGCGGSNNAPEPYTGGGAGSAAEGPAQSTAEEAVPSEQDEATVDNEEASNAESEENAAEEEASNAEAEEVATGDFLDDVTILPDDSGLFEGSQGLYPIILGDVKDEMTGEAPEYAGKTPLVRVKVPVSYEILGSYDVSPEEKGVPDLGGAGMPVLLDVLEQEHVETSGFYPDLFTAQGEGGTLRLEVTPVRGPDGEILDDVASWRETFPEGLTVGDQEEAWFAVGEENGLPEGAGSVLIYPISEDYTLLMEYLYGVNGDMSNDKLAEALYGLVVPLED